MQRKVEIPNYNANSDDYINTITEGSQKVGLCEIQGVRPTQEDKIAVDFQSAKILQNTKPADVVRAFNKTFKDIHAQTANMTNQGSTCVTTTAWIDPITNKVNTCTANVGDSEAMLVIVRANGTVESKRLNSLHNADNANEVARVQNQGGYIGDNKRLGKRLAVTRAIGDNEFDSVGISHDPEVSFDNSSVLGKGDVAFVVMGCDGLTDGIKGDKNKTKSHKAIANVVQANKDKQPEEIAKALVAQAYGVNHSQDNISAAVFRVSTTPTSVAVCDGHGGPDVSALIAKKLYTGLNQQLAQGAHINPGPTLDERLNNFSRTKRLADTGDAKAQAAVAKLYETGDGVPGNLIVAKQYYEEASANGHAPALEDCKRLAKRLESYYAIEDLLRDIPHESSVDNNNLLRINFPNKESCAPVSKLFANHISLLDPIRDTGVSINLTDALKTKLADPNQFQQMKAALGATSPQAANVSHVQPAPPANQKTSMERTSSFLAPQSLEKIQQAVNKDSWKVKEAPSPADKKIYQVVDDKNVTRFEVHPNRLTSRKTDRETFLAMMKAYQKIHGDKLPQVTCGKNTIELWKSVYKEVYPQPGINLDEKIKVATKPPAPVKPPTPVQPQKKAVEEETPQRRFRC